MSSDLWSFSLTTYARPGVEHACLQLQSAGSNVCLLLCGLWLGQRGVACNEQRLQLLRTVAEPWDADVVRPLRALRTQWKALATEDPELNTLREQVKTLELEAERHLLLRLERSAQSWPQGDAADLSAWLEGVTAGAVHLDRDALLELRVAVTGTS
ncbi:TIGR02444 family protein [Pseudomonas sp. NPDC086251]|uniref:TIGR02444 family protein n=1 Tax=Pseudomonas sp. NPDC086251 TaxID=3364431 RepID=UPI0038323B52